MNHPEIVLILAMARNGVIGADNGLPWHIPADLRRFKALTQGKPMVMGRKTFDSLPGVLPGRRHIVLTRDSDWEDEGAEPVPGLDSAIRLANAPHISIIGGADVFRQFLPRADRIELTEIHADYQGDVVLRDFPGSGWQETARTDVDAQGSDPAYSFVSLVRRDDR